MNKFADKYSINKEKIAANWDVLQGEGVKAPIGKQNNNLLGWFKNIRINEYTVVFVWSCLSAFMIFSIYYLSIFKREKDYGMLKVLGCSRLRLFAIVFIELLILFVLGFILGYWCGNFLMEKMYQNLIRIFLPESIPIIGYRVNFTAITFGFTVTTLLLFLITMIIIHHIYKAKSLDLIRKNEKTLLKRRRILSYSNSHLIYSIACRFITIRKKMLFFVIISLSIGNIIFLTANYTLKELKEQKILEIKSDSGLGSDYRIYIGNTDLDKGIPEEKLKLLHNIKGIKDFYAFRYTLSSVILNASQYPNKHYFDPENEDKRLKEMTGGICTRQDNGSYLLRSNLWGYDKKAINSLNEYLIAGKINYQDIKENHKIIVRLSMSGTGKYDSVKIKPGDKIKIKVPKIQCYNDPKILEFQNDSLYNVIEAEVAATIKDVPTKNEYFIDTSGIDIIMDNRAFLQDTGIPDFNQVEMTKLKKQSERIINTQLSRITSDITNGIFVNHTIEVDRAESNYKQQLFIFGLMAFAIVLMSLLYVANCTRYLITMWKHEIYILKAIGLSKRQLYNMMILEAFIYSFSAFLLTAIFSSLSIGLVYLVLKRVLFFYKVTIQLSWCLTAVLGIGIFIVCLFIMLVSARSLMHSFTLKTKR